ncbi:helix-turn-helix domain-containing protein [Mucilaginibacter sp. SP1R1]|uniref:helix-turn-helix domain-containing protein n=1 Tax=Mucilaginibacter sp. SP1R1 TaxID=2723091 RepID=UPI0016104BA5|nr:helix-turn-helix transcriptional regulator [Mucilaginibacter sp. SP1R1]MBB6152274.1 plasmid maintenance system antidote protein VapI [Mucilaginibacter sp. SP1R1]
MPTTAEYQDIAAANRLQMFRMEYINKSQNAAAKMLGVPQSNLSYMESGKSPIRFDFIHKLVHEYKLNIDWLSTGHGDKISETPATTKILTDFNKVDLELHQLKKFVKMIELTQNHLIRLLEAQAKEIEALKKKIK